MSTLLTNPVMTTYKPTRCIDCDAMLWSAYAKAVCLCSDCEVVDSDKVQDLEERLQDALN